MILPSGSLSCDFLALYYKFMRAFIYAGHPVICTMVSKYKLIISVLFLGILAYLLSKLDIGAVYEQMLKANKIFLVIATSVFILMLLLKIQKFVWISRYYSHTMFFKQAALVQMVGIAIATLTPGRVGEGSKVILMKNHLGMPMRTSLSIVILERILDIIVLSGGAFLLSLYIVKSMAFLTGLLFLLIVVAFFLFTRFPIRFHGFIPEKYRGHLSVEIKKERFLFTTIFISTFLIWASEAMFQWILLRSFDTHVPIYLVFGIFCIGTIAVFFSVLPAGLGSVELSYFLLYPQVGVPIEVAAAVVLIYRFFAISTPFISSALILNYYKLAPGDIRREMEE
jgi:uncharacterized membrane protein YbhN (UPF0104 family)